MNQTGTSGETMRKPRGGRRWSLLAKVRLAVGIVFTGILLFCCLAMMLFPVKATVKPGEVQAVALQFGPLKLPDNFFGTKGITAENAPFWLQIACFEHRDGRGQMVIGGYHVKSALATEKEDLVWLQWLIDRFAPDIRLLDVQEKHEKTIEIRGKPAVFEIVEGVDRGSTTRVKQVSGSFNGPGGPAKIILQAEIGYLSDQAIEDLLESLTQASEVAPQADGNLNSK